ncbi:MAG: 2-C-methyl-D-erythritol 2,4-cyclodiphosphate synthase [Oscillospiraceae bacterium]|nr:2-C-methyl-D-erythritol 2,4-cyclodiphosphate synthase [Oscillospiraceae bacterium]
MMVGIGQDSHRFGLPGEAGKDVTLGGVAFNCGKKIIANSDGDVVLHALTNAISGITCVNVMGETADKMCLENSISNSAEYVQEALKSLNNAKISNVSFSIECLVPKITPSIPQMRENIAALLGIKQNFVGITATTGEGLTAFGKGEGIQVFCTILTEG